MRRSRLFALVMCFAILMSLFTSCKAEKNGKKTVKADDPWFESTRFKLEKKVKNTDDFIPSCVCAGADKIFNIYCESYDGWATSKTILDTYDDSGNLLDRKTVSFEGNYGFQEICSVCSDSEGKKLSLTVRYHSPVDRSYYAFADIDVETGIVTEVYEIKVKDLHSISKAVFIKDYTILVSNVFEGDILGYALFIYKDKELVAGLDLSTIKLFYLFDGLSLDEEKGLLYAAGFDETGSITMEFDINTGKLKSKKSSYAADDENVNPADYATTDKGELCKIDSFGNIIKLDINTMTPRTVVDTEWYTPYFPAPSTDEYYSHTRILSCTDDRIVIHNDESTTYGNASNTNYEYIRVLKKSDKNPHAGKTIVELALPVNSGITDYLARTIYQFNQEDNEYIIRVWNKYKTGLNLGRSVFGAVDEDEQKVYQMIQDLRGDDAPDLVIGIQKNYAMRDDVFMDLTGFLDPDVMEKQFGNIIEAGRINGKLYFLPVTLKIEGLVTNKELLKDGAVGITFDEYDKLIKEEMNGFSPYDHAFTLAYNKRSFILSCIDTKKAIEGDKIEFGTEQFRAAVEYANENIPYENEKSMPESYDYDYSKRYRGECYYEKIDDFLDYVRACRTTEGQYTIIGTPSVDASGPRFTAIETISVSATTDAKEGCRKFLNYLFSGSAFAPSECEFKQIVTNKDVMNNNLKILSDINNKAVKNYQDSKASKAIIVPMEIDTAYGDKEATDNMRDSFINSLSSITVYYYEDYAIVQFLDEELKPYFAGDRSLDDAIKFINDRTTKYVREM